jgi:ribulose 1,5-bisphosphate synthetase/thiazole synthase
MSSGRPITQGLLKERVVTQTNKAGAAGVVVNWNNVWKLAILRMFAAQKLNYRHAIRLMLLFIER